MDAGTASVLLWWMPVGAGDVVVAHTSEWWERWRAYRERRARLALRHAALDVFVARERYLIEMAPAWGVPAVERGVVATGPVGVRLLGRSRLFRYEVRCWRDGVLPDRQYAVAAPVRIEVTDAAARRILRDTALVPPLVWGRSVAGVDDMWNSNSLVSWLLVRAGVDAEAVAPPNGARAPGWRAGIVAATRRGSADRAPGEAPGPGGRGRRLSISAARGIRPGQRTRIVGGMSEPESQQKAGGGPNWGVGVALGMGIGVAFGVALENIALGFALGFAIGIGFAFATGTPRSGGPDDEPGPAEGEPDQGESGDDPPSEAGPEDGGPR